MRLMYHRNPCAIAQEEHESGNSEMYVVTHVPSPFHKSGTAAGASGNIGQDARALHNAGGKCYAGNVTVLQKSVVTAQLLEPGASCVV